MSTFLTNYLQYKLLDILSKISNDYNLDLQILAKLYMPHSCTYMIKNNNKIQQNICIALKKNGTRCERLKKEGSDLCGIHFKKDNNKIIKNYRKTSYVDCIYNNLHLLKGDVKYF